MMKSPFCITREKHMDHMVRVVPFIVTAYAIQCYFIRQLASLDFAVDGLLFLGATLVAMIAGFVVYDLTHTVKFEEETLTITVKWLRFQKIISYQDIVDIELSEEGQTFTTLKLTTKSGKKFGFYFIDDADKIKSWIEQKRTPELQAAA